MYAIPNKTIILLNSVLLYVCVVAGSPGKVGGLELTYHSEQELRLQWSRPGDFPSDVLITYHINITNISSGAVTQVGHDTCVSYEITTYCTISSDDSSHCVYTVLRAMRSQRRMCW